MTSISKAKNDSDLKIIEDLAFIIWTEHYTPIIGPDQVTYMLEKFQSFASTKKQIKDGAQYYIIQHQNSPIGYLSFYKKEGSLFLSKIYVLSNLRGKGIGKQAMDFIQNKASEMNCNSITLTVNKYNTNSIKAYEKMGFKNIKAIIMDIGGGYIMDDYFMEKKIEVF